MMKQQKSIELLNKAKAIKITNYDGVEILPEQLKDSNESKYAIKLMSKSMNITFFNADGIPTVKQTTTNIVKFIERVMQTYNSESTSSLSQG